MFNLLQLAQHRAWTNGIPYAVVRRPHGISVMSERLAIASKAEILAVRA